MPAVIVAILNGVEDRREEATVRLGARTTRRAGETDLGALIQGMAAGEEAALERFYDLSVGKAYALASRIMRDAAAAEEAVEDAYFQVWRDAGRYDPGRGNPLAWLLTIVRSRALDALRRRDSAETYADRLDCEERIGTDDAGPGDLLETMERASAVHAALSELSPQARQLIGLAFFRGLTHQEISAECQMPLGTVKTVIHRACQKLRSRLAVSVGALS